MIILGKGLLGIVQGQMTKTDEDFIEIERKEGRCVFVMTDHVKTQILEPSLFCLGVL